jgi:hypothetical protein
VSKKEINEVRYLKWPLNILSIIVLLGLVVGGGIFFIRWNARQARLCTREAVCSFKDVSLSEKVPSLSREALKLLDQPFFFLDEGKQCRVYESADKKYVIKFFKKPSKKKAFSRLQDSVQGAVLARLVLPEETATVALSIKDQNIHLPTVTLLNCKGKVEKISLKDTPFILQRKAVPLKETLLTLISEKKTTQAATYLQSLFTLLAHCRQKGVVDRDGSLIRNGNVGFVDGKAVLLDTGKLARMKDPKRQTLHDLNRLKPLLSWLEKSCPELVPVFKTCQKNYEKQGVIHGS